MTVKAEGPACTRRSAGYRAEQARVMRRHGASYQVIADALGYCDRSAARKAAERGQAAWMLASDEDARLAQLSELEMMMSILRPLAHSESNRLKAIELMLKVMDRQAKLAGLYKERVRPDVTTVEVPNTAAMDKLDAIERFQTLIDGMSVEAFLQLKSLPPSDDDDDFHAGDPGAGFVPQEGRVSSEAPNWEETFDDEGDDDVETGHWHDGRWIPDPPSDVGHPSMSDDAGVKMVERAFSMS
jgi:hypothetical protein